MFETLTQMVLSDHMGGRTFEPPEGPSGYSRMLAPHRAPYATKDGYVCLLVYNDKQWRAFFRLIGGRTCSTIRASRARKPARATSPRSTLLSPRQLETRTSAEWLRLLRAADIPVTPLNTVDDLIDDEHLRQTGFFSTIDHPSEGKLRSMAVPGRWSQSRLPRRVRRRAWGAQRRGVARGGLSRRRNRRDDRRRRDAGRIAMKPSHGRADRGG
jgi:crotonobetainyl-CoA:carnitine CoA-transferase CaiB-like acyl-CoA transferase